MVHIIKNEKFPFFPFLITKIVTWLICDKSRGLNIFFCIFFYWFSYMMISCYIIDIFHYNIILFCKLKIEDRTLNCNICWHFVPYIISYYWFLRTHNLTNTMLYTKLNWFNLKIKSLSTEIELLNFFIHNLFEMNCNMQIYLLFTWTSHSIKPLSWNFN